MRALLTFLLFSLLHGPAQAQDQITEVDLELVLMVDVSRSMSERELEIQRRGYAEALRSEAVSTALRSGLLQRVAMTYVEWAGTQEVVVDWRLLENREDLEAFAQVLTTKFDPALRRTSISGAILHGMRSLDSNAFEGLRQVIDISGDGPNNLGQDVTSARDRAVARGITINGLPLLTREGLGQAWHLDRLDLYYEACVIGGLGAFVIAVLDWADFAQAVRRKLVLEMVSRPTGAQIIRTQSSGRDPTDCRIGEKIWKERQSIWAEP